MSALNISPSISGTRATGNDSATIHLMMMDIWRNINLPFKCHILDKMLVKLTFKNRLGEIVLHNLDINIPATDFVTEKHGDTSCSGAFYRKFLTAYNFENKNKEREKGGGNQRSESK